MFVFLGQAIWIGSGESVGVCPGVLQREVFCQGQLDKIAAFCVLALQFWALVVTLFMQLFLEVSASSRLSPHKRRPKSWGKRSL